MGKRGIFGLKSRSAGNAIQQAGGRLTALSLMYQVERQDKANNVLAGLTLIAAALAYLGIAALVLNGQHPRQFRRPPGPASDRPKASQPDQPAVP